jgi:hypothetical protein
VALNTQQGSTYMSYQTVNPYTGELVKTYPYATDQEIDATIEKAHQAFLSWRTTVSGDRAKILTRAAELLRADKPALAEILTLEMGKITAEAEAEVELSLDPPVECRVWRLLTLASTRRFGCVCPAADGSAACPGVPGPGPGAVCLSAWGVVTGFGAGQAARAGGPQVSVHRFCQACSR